MLAIRKSLIYWVKTQYKISSGNEALQNKVGSHDEERLEKPKVRLSKQFDDERRANIMLSRKQK